MVLTQRRRSQDDIILPTADDYDPKAKPDRQKSLLEQPVVRAALAALAAILLMGGGFFYGSLQREEREQRRQRRAAAAARAGAGPSALFEPSNLAIVEEEERSQGPPPRLFSVDDLAKGKAAYERDPDRNPLLLSIVGHVFDVSKGSEYYAPGQGYDFFTFRDGSRAFVTGTFTEEGLTDDLTGLGPGECHAVLRWLRFFQDKADYPYVGRLIGTFFAPGTGALTPAYLAFRECAYQTVLQSDEETPPACSTRWAKDEGTTVWCEEAGLVPRRQGIDGRCVCVDPTEANAHDVARGLEVYEGCEPHAERCTY